MGASVGTDAWGRATVHLGGSGNPDPDALLFRGIR